MPLFELSPSGVRPFRRINSSAELYEREIETLFWENLEAFVGEPLFPLVRQPRLPGGGIPDLVALDAQGRVLVIEIKRDIDRGQLAQCLEYAGWARSTNLDELAGLYREGAERFFTDWQEFTGTTTPMLLERAPRLTLVARSFDSRTESALNFLRESGVPLKLIQIVFYEDASGARIADVDNGDLESRPQIAAPAGVPVRASRPSNASTARPPSHLWVDRLISSAKSGSANIAARAGVGVTLMDLLEAGRIRPNEVINWSRPQVGQSHRATISENGEVVLVDGRSFASLSTAANVLANGSYNGWECWTVPRLGNVKIGTLRADVTSQPGSE